MSIRSTNSSKAGFLWVLRMAWRDGKASARKLTLFMASIVLGIAAVVSIQSFGDNLKKNISIQSRSLMGADFIIDLKQPPNERVLAIMDSLGGASAKEINFPSMASFLRNGSSKLVQIRGIEGGFPFYGELDTEPKNAATEYQTRGAALVDATVMLQLGIVPGDSIKVGEVTLPIAGALKSVPGSSSVFSSIAPPVVIPYRYISATGLIQKGSRLDYEYYFVASPDTDLEELDKVLDPMLDAQEADLDTHLSTSRNLGRRYDNFGKFLNLVAFIALLLGCVGIASAVHVYIKGKLPNVAVLKCLGATKRQTFLIYLTQIAAIGFLGGLIGTAGGLVLQQGFPVILQDLLPVAMDISLAPQAIFMGLSLGICMSVLFALYPLMATLYVSPLQALRVGEGSANATRPVAILVFGSIFFFIFLFSYWLLKDWRYALGFVGGILVVFAILVGMAHLLMRTIKTYFPVSWGFPARQSLLNLFRPQNQTLILILAIGVGTFLISTLYFTKDLLLAQAGIDTESDSPNMILLDVQDDQREDVSFTIGESDLAVLDDIPIVTMRVQNVKGRDVNEIRTDTTSKVNRWILNHEFRVTYRDSLTRSETLQSGEWIKEMGEGNEIPISVSDNFARDAMVTVGDTLIFNVQGVLMTTFVSNIREVDWSRMQPNFTLVFPTGVLENAPQFRVMTTHAPNEAVSAGLQQDLVRKFPNISILDLRQILTVIEGLLNKISWIINFMAFFSILTGIVVLLGAVRTG
ncbi:MAG TPA: FtsX-like permease family protein, partial [Arenibacter sp.]|nr:FtsX-like permease family protein [Arenibacter sp.]